MRLVGKRTWLLAAVFAVLLSAWVNRPAAAGTDLSGTWEVDYSMVCSATIEQAGSGLSMAISCGESLDGTLTGIIDLDTGEFNLSGFVETTIPVGVEGSTSPDGSSMSGAWIIPDFAPAGTFSGTRDTPVPGGVDLTGDWTINIGDVFATSCQAVVEQSGTDVSAVQNCSGLMGTVQGSIDIATGKVTLSGEFIPLIPMELQAIVSSDGRSMSGSWAVLPTGPSGTFVATREAGPPGDPTPTGPPAATATAATATAASAPVVTATPSVEVAELPAAGIAGAGGGSTAAWLIAASASAIAGAVALGATAWYARRRWLT